MEKVIITGASGFIGKALTKHLLDQGVIVYAIVRNTEKLSDLKEYSNLHIVECEMSQYHTLVEKIEERFFDVCFHFAWEGMVGWKSNDVQIQINDVKYSCDLMNVVNELKISKFIFADTISQNKVIPIQEDGYTVLNNADIYGIAKLATYKMLCILAVRSKIQFISTIFTNVYGIGDYSKRSTNILINYFLNDINPKLASRDCCYDWIYIDDVVKGLIAVAHKGKNLKRYYIGSRKLKTLGEIITEVGQILAPNISLEFGTYDDNSYIDYDAFFNDDLYQDTGFECKADFKESILKTAEWVKTLEF